MTAVTPFQRLLRFVLRRRMRKAFRRLAWEEYRSLHGWTEEDLVPSYAFQGFLLMAFAALCFFLWWRGFTDPLAGTVTLTVGIFSFVSSLLFFLLDLDAPRQKAFQKREARRTDST